LKKRQQDPSKHFNTEGELSQAAQEGWEMLNWAVVDRSIDSMSKPVQHDFSKYGGYTKS
jgi:hypothetical protein